MCTIMSFPYDMSRSTDDENLTPDNNQRDGGGGNARFHVAAPSCSQDSLSTHNDGNNDDQNLHNDPALHVHPDRLLNGQLLPESAQWTGGSPGQGPYNNNSSTFLSPYHQAAAGGGEDPSSMLSANMSQKHTTIGRRASRLVHDNAMNSALIRQMNLSRHKLKATSRTSALLAGFAMVALVELDYKKADLPPVLLIVFAVTTTLLVSVHLLALMMSTCMLPHMEAIGSSPDSPHITLRWYIDLSWFFSTCLGLILFLLEIGVVFWIKFLTAKFVMAAYVTTALLVPVFVIFLLFTFKFYKKLMSHHMQTRDRELSDLRQMLGEDLPLATPPPSMSSLRNLHVV